MTRHSQTSLSTRSLDIVLPPLFKIRRTDMVTKFNFLFSRLSAFRSRRSIAKSEGPSRQKLKLSSFAQVSAASHTFVECVYCAPCSSQSSNDFCIVAGRQVNHATKLGERLPDFHVLTTHHRNWLNDGIQNVTERLNLGIYPKKFAVPVVPKPRSATRARPRKNFGCLQNYHCLVRQIRTMN